MGSVTEFLRSMNWWGLLGLLINAAAALICITFHELSHGLAAYRLGDPTAKNAGRLTLNPVKHLDVIGLIMLLIVKVGWAKPVPVDMRHFRHPKRGMALTAMAGPISNFIMALLATAVCSLIYHAVPITGVSLCVLCFFANLALLSVGFGVFNLIPVSPLDGSKVLFALLPDRIYYKILRYERYIMLVLILLVLFGVFDRPLSFLINHILFGLCRLTGMPVEFFLIGLNASEILSLF